MRLGVQWRNCSFLRGGAALLALASGVLVACSSGTSGSRAASSEHDPAQVGNEVGSQLQHSESQADDDMSFVPASSAAPLGTSGAAEMELARYDLVAAVGHSAQDRALIDAAWASVFTTCMRQAGVDVPAATQPSVDRGAERELAVLRFDDMALISEYGYHWTGLDWAGIGDDLASGSSSEIPAGYEANEEPCKQSANDRLSNGVPTGDFENLLLEGQQSVRARLRSWPERESYQQQWSVCMDEYGHPDQRFADPDRVRPFLEQPVSQFEIDIALADATCRSESGYRDALLSEMAAGVETWLSENEQLVLSIRERIATEVETAKAVLDGE